LSWLRFRTDVGTPANINARISHLAERETASSEKPAAVADRQRAARELFSGEIPEGQTLESTDYADYTDRTERLSHKKAQEAQKRLLSFALVPLCGPFCSV
jgi:hypothetical protein